MAELPVPYECANVINNIHTHIHVTRHSLFIIGLFVTRTETDKMSACSLISGISEYFRNVGLFYKL